MTTDRPGPGLGPVKIPEPVLKIASTLAQADHDVWCVGGALRDHLIRQRKAGPLLGGDSDIDLATSARPDEVQRLFRGRTVPVGIKHGTVGVLDRNRTLHEVTTFRHDVTTDGRHAVVAFGASLEEDLARRDFTINALAYHPLNQSWRDPFGGAADIDAEIVRAVGEPLQRFREDYLRILRAIRFAARFRFMIEPATWAAARASADGLRQLSAERVRDEWFKSLRTARNIAELVRLWWEVGAAERWMPELAPAAAAASLPPVINDEPRDPVLLTILLTSDSATVLERMRASGAEVSRAAAVMKAPAEPADGGVATVRHWLASAGNSAEDLMELHRLRTGAPAPWARDAEAIRTRREPLTRGALAVSGNDLVASGIPAGPELGRILDELLRKVLDDPSVNTRESLLSMARALAEERP